MAIRPTTRIIALRPTRMRGAFCCSLLENPRGYDAPTPKQIDALADELLTFIEQREAEQIAYGIYNITMTGADVLEGFALHLAAIFTDVCLEKSASRSFAYSLLNKSVLCRRENAVLAS